MNQKKNRGFTLIELLAVIVILAIIALIAVPIIMNIINKANESAFKDTAYGVISAGELYFAEQQLEPNGMLEDVTFNLPDTTKTLQLKGEVPTGQILITKEGKVAIAVYNNRYCVTKGLDDNDVEVTEDVENCKLPSVEEEPEGNTPDGGDQGGNTTQTGSVSSLATTSTEVPEKPACLTDGTTCTSGTPVAIQVNSTEVYNFYVIDETENEIILMMDRNIYASGNTTEPDVQWYYDSLTTSKGPITALRALKTRTSGWTNIPEREYVYSDDSGKNYYSGLSETMRARMLTYTEAKKLKGDNEVLPEWTITNLKKTGDANTSGYWLSSASSGDYAHHITYDGEIAPTSVSNYYGLRPVITLTK